MGTSLAAPRGRPRDDETTAGAAMHSSDSYALLLFVSAQRATTETTRVLRGSY